jgi:hypothetical protein
LYGPAPGPDADWLKVRPAIIAMYATMLPRLEAEAEMRAYHVALAAGGLQMEERGRAQYINSLERQASGAKRPKKPTAASLESMGIQVEIEKEAGGDS